MAKRPKRPTDRRNVKAPLKQKDVECAVTVYLEPRHFVRTQRRHAKSVLRRAAKHLVFGTDLNRIILKAKFNPTWRTH